jgi:hypothetical protein
MARSKAMDASAPRKGRKTACAPDEREQSLGKGNFGRDPLTFIDCRNAAAGSSAIPATDSTKHATQPTLRSQLVSHFGSGRQQESKVSAKFHVIVLRTGVVKVGYGTAAACHSCRPAPSGRSLPKPRLRVRQCLFDAGNSDNHIAPANTRHVDTDYIHGRCRQDTR